MGKKNERLDRLSDLVEANKAVSIQDLIRIFEECERTIRRDLKQLDAMTSYTHRGKFITLPYIPSFDVNGIWFYKGIGFTKHRNSLDLIVSIINAKESITKEEIEEISKIKISKQIQILIEQDRLHRVKLGAKYCYISEELAKDKKLRMLIMDLSGSTLSHCRLIISPSLMRVYIAVSKIGRNQSLASARSFLASVSVKARICLLSSSFR